MPDVLTQDIDLGVGSTNLTDPEFLVDLRPSYTLRVRPGDLQGEYASFCFRQQNQSAPYNKPVVGSKIAPEHLCCRVSLP